MARRRRKISKKEFEWRTKYKTPDAAPNHENDPGEVVSRGEEEGFFRDAAQKYIEISTKDKAAIFTSVKFLYDKFKEWNEKYVDAFTVSSFATYVKEVYRMRESVVNIRLKLYTYKGLQELRWDPKPGISFTRYREILTRDISTEDKSDLLQRLEDPNEKMKAREFRALIKSKRKRKDNFSVLKDPIIYESNEQVLTKIQELLEQCGAIPKGAIISLKINRRNNPNLS